MALRKVVDDDRKKVKRGRPKGSKTKKKSKIKLQEKQNLFENELPRIRELLDQKENDGAISLTQKGMLESSLKMLPILEARYHKEQNDRTIYAFNNMVTSVRELLADLQATSDRAAVLDNLIYNILEPQLLSFANYIVESNYQLKKELKESIKSKDRKHVHAKIDENSNAAAAYTSEIFKNLKERISNALSE